MKIKYTLQKLPTGSEVEVAETFLDDKNGHSHAFSIQRTFVRSTLLHTSCSFLPNDSLLSLFTLIHSGLFLHSSSLCPCRMFAVSPSPLHHSETLLPPGEAAAAAQTEAPGAAVDGWSALVPLYDVLQRHGGGSHSQSGSWDDKKNRPRISCTALSVGSFVWFSTSRTCWLLWNS